MLSTGPEEKDDLEADDIAESLALDEAMSATALKTRGWDYADLVREFKAVEAEFVKRAGDNEYFALETKRRIAELILVEAHGSRQPFETCRDIWNELLRLGFIHIERKCPMTWFFADCCRKTKEPEAGLAVLEPLIAELERSLAEPTVTKNEATYYRHELNSLGQLAAKLKVQQGLPVEIPPDIPEVALGKAMSDASRKMRKSSFDEQVREYKAVEAEFLQRAGDNASIVLEVKQRVADSILEAACDTDQSFDTCRNLWDELLRLSPSNSGGEFIASSRYAEHCLQNKQFEAGIAVVEPIIAEIERDLADPEVKKHFSARFTRDKLVHLRELLGELKAQQGQP